MLHEGGGVVVFGGVTDLDPHYIFQHVGVCVAKLYLVGLNMVLLRLLPRQTQSL